MEDATTAGLFDCAYCKGPTQKRLCITELTWENITYYFCCYACKFFWRKRKTEEMNDANPKIF